MTRRIQISLTPSEALTALAALYCAPSDIAALAGHSAAVAVFGARFGHEVARAFEAHTRALDALGQCLDWLERRGLATIERPRGRVATREHPWRCRCELRVDVRCLARDVASEAADADSKARASAWAVRAVLRHLANTNLHAYEARSGAERIPATEALAAYDVAMSAAGYGPHAAPPARLAHLAARVRRRDDDEAAPEAPPAAPAPTPVATATKPAATKPAATKPERDARAHTGDASTKRERARPAAKSAAGFGGLPDDATSEDRRTGDVYGARGLTTDAEHFLTEGAIATWPCDAATLERARRQVVSRLHPDRAGEASTSLFHRAIKGHAELLAKLTALGSAAPAAPPAPSAAPPAAPTPVEASAPEAPVAPKPPRTRRARASAARVDEAPAVSAAPVSATTHEWPPRAHESQRTRDDSVAAA